MNLLAHRCRTLALSLVFCSMVPAGLSFGQAIHEAVDEPLEPVILPKIRMGGFWKQQAAKP